MKKHLKVVQTKSTIGQQSSMRLTLKGLGLRGPGFRGAIKKVLHLVSVEEVDHG
jgi:large subunit ribosomal protein L30